MRKNWLLQFVYVLTAFSLALPWFTYDAKMMGYCWGFRFLHWMAVPMAATALYVFSIEKKTIKAILAEISTVVNLGILVIAFGRWQEFSNIVEGFQWNDGLHTATVGYWISAVSFLTLFVLLQWDIMMKNRDRV